MKRRIPLALALATTVVSLSACGGNSGETNETARSESGALTAENCADPDAATAEITDEIVIGLSMPLSGAAAQSVAEVVAGMDARFRAQNADGGVGGVEIAVKKRDDAFTPERARNNVTALIQNDGADVLSTFGGGQVDAMADFQNEQCVPLLLASSSVPKYYDPEGYPWTTQYLPESTIEQELVVKSMETQFADGAKVALAVNPNESGQSYREAFTAAAEGSNVEIVAEEEFTDPNTAISTLKNSGADVLNIAGISTDCLSLTSALGRSDWKPEMVQAPSNCSDGALLFAPAGGGADGVQIMRWLKEPTLAEYAEDPAVLEYLDAVKDAGAKNPESSYTVGGWVVADLMIDAFTKAAESEDGLSRLSIMNAVAAQDYHPDLFVDGVDWQFGQDDYRGIESMQPFEWDADEGFTPVGDVLSKN